MSQTYRRTLGWMLLLVVVVSPVATARGGATKFPSWPTCQGIAQEEAAKLAPGQPVTRSFVSALAGKLKARGWVVRDLEAILELVPADDEFLVQQLGTARGKVFAQTLVRRPDDYSRLDRLSHLPDGQKMIRDLMGGPAGYHQMLTYMISTEGGKQLWSIVPNSRDAHDFNSPTGRIYTSEQLVAALEQSYSREKAAREKKPR